MEEKQLNLESKQDLQGSEFSGKVLGGGETRQRVSPLDALSSREKTRRTVKLDFNLILAGLIVNDSDTVVKKTVRVDGGTLKGLYAIPVKTHYGNAYVCNGAEFPTPTTVEVLLFLLYLAEQQNWNREIRFSSVREFLRSMGKKEDGRTMEQLKRSLVILSNHSYYFENSFYDAESGKKKTVYFGVVDDFKWNDDGSGVVVRLNEELVKIFSTTKWYRRVPLEDFFALKGETAKALFLYLLNYHKNSGNWEVYLPDNLVEWYKNITNSKATTLKPSRVKSLIQKAVDEIDRKTILNCWITDDWKRIVVVSPEEFDVVGESSFPSLPDSDKGRAGESADCPSPSSLPEPESKPETREKRPAEESKAKNPIEEKRERINRELTEEELKELVLYLKQRWTKLNAMGVKVSWKKVREDFLKKHSVEEIKKLAGELVAKRKASQSQAVEETKKPKKKKQERRTENNGDIVSLLMNHLRKGQPILKSICRSGKISFEKKGNTIFAKIKDSLTKKAFETLVMPHIDGLDIRVVME